MTSIYDIRQKAQLAAGGQTCGDQLSMIPDAPGMAAQRADPSADTGGRDYRAIYRAVSSYHERHSPPRLTPEYWQSAAKGISETAASLNNDPFALALLNVVYGEMERGYNALKGHAENVGKGIEQR